MYHLLPRENKYATALVGRTTPRNEAQTQRFPKWVDLPVWSLLTAGHFLDDLPAFHRKNAEKVSGRFEALGGCLETSETCGFMK
jgi:hypothetical protein